MYFIKLYTNTASNLNEIQEVSVKGYGPIAVASLDFIRKKKISFTVGDETTVAGVLIVDNTGELIYHQDLSAPLKVSAGQVVDISFG